MKFQNVTQTSTSSIRETTAHRINEVKEGQETLIASLDISTVDQAVVDWFYKTLDLYVTGQNGKRIKVHIEFATQERWYKALKEKGMRDKAGRILLPHGSIRRVSEVHDERYMPQDKSTEMIISKTEYKERSAQYVGSRTTQRPFNKIVYDIYTVPHPIYVTVEYEFVIQTSYVTQMNEIEMQIFEANGIKEHLFWISAEGYSFFTKLDQPSDQSNIEDFSDGERIIKKSFPLTVSAYLLPTINNQPSKIKHYRTSTRLDFGQETVIEGELK